MRLDDRLACALARPDESLADVHAVWGKLAVALADPNVFPAVLRAWIIDYLDRRRDVTPLDIRREAATRLAGRDIPSDLLELFLNDRPEVRAPVVPRNSGNGSGETPGFAFETCTGGIVTWTDYRPRGAIIGYNLYDPERGRSDAINMAFTVRSEISSGTFHFGGAGNSWSISAQPVFSAATGIFLGYSGTATPDGAEALDQQPTDALHQLAHEVRTPLNAIIGFGEMIEQQMIGPVAASHRTRASAILEHAHQLQVVLSRLDMTTGRENSSENSCNAKTASAIATRR